MDGEKQTWSEQFGWCLHLARVRILVHEPERLPFAKIQLSYQCRTIELPSLLTNIPANNISGLKENSNDEIHLKWQ